MRSIIPVPTQAGRSEKGNCARRLSNAPGMAGNSTSFLENESAIQISRSRAARFEFKGTNFRSPSHRHSEDQLNFVMQAAAEQVVDPYRAL